MRLLFSGSLQTQPTFASHKKTKLSALAGLAMLASSPALAQDISPKLEMCMTSMNQAEQIAYLRRKLEEAAKVSHESVILLPDDARPKIALAKDDLAIAHNSLAPYIHAGDESGFLRIDHPPDSSRLIGENDRIVAMRNALTNWIQGGYKYIQERLKHSGSSPQAVEATTALLNKLSDSACD